MLKSSREEVAARMTHNYSRSALNEALMLFYWFLKKKANSRPFSTREAGKAHRGFFASFLLFFRRFSFPSSLCYSVVYFTFLWAENVRRDPKSRAMPRQTSHSPIISISINPTTNPKTPISSTPCESCDPSITFKAELLWDSRQAGVARLSMSTMLINFWRFFFARMLSGTEKKKVFRPSKKGVKRLKRRNKLDDFVHSKLARLLGRIRLGHQFSSLKINESIPVVIVELREAFPGKWFSGSARR